MAAARSAQAAFVAFALLGALAGAQADYPIVPGLCTSAGPDGAVIAHGYDPVFAQARGSVLGYTYDNLNNNYNVWQEPESGTYYKLPDQFTIEQLPASQIDTAMQTYTTAEEYQESQFHAHSSGFNLFFFSFSQSDGQGYAHDMLKEHAHTMYEATALIVQYKMETTPVDVLKWEYTNTAPNQGSQVNADFHKDSMALPETLESVDDSVAYRAFIDKYGTHYVETAFFGGALDMLIVVDNSSTTTHSSQYNYAQAAAGIDLVFLSFGMNAGGNHSSGTLTQDFKEHSQVVIRSFGGDPATVHGSKFDQWPASVHLQPAPINSTFRPLEALFTDATRAGNFEKAYEQYVKAPPIVTDVCAAPPGMALGLSDVHPSGNRRLVAESRPSWDTIERLAEEQRRKKATATKEEPATSTLRGTQVKQAPTASKVAVPSTVDRTPVPGHVDVNTPVIPFFRDVAQELAANPVEHVLRSDDQPDILPGVFSGIGRGFDGKTGTIKLPVATLGYVQDKTWFDPVANKTWSVPDELEFVATPSTCERESLVELRNASDVYQYNQHYSGFNIGLSIPLGATGITLDLGATFEQEAAKLGGLTKNFSWSASLLTRKISEYELSFGAGSTQLASVFKTALAQLPSTYGPKYDQLVSYWGTHYIAKADFGGYCNVTVVFNKDYANKYGWSEANHQVGLSIGLSFASSGIGVDLGFGFGSGHNNSHVDGKFTSESNTYWACAGGDAVLWQAGKYDEWKTSLRQNPAMVQGSTQLRPIHLLIADPAKRAAMQTAILNYLKS